MFKFFTWAKFGGWCLMAAGLITGPIGGVLGLSPQLIGGIGTILAGISSLVTTSKAGTATNAAGAQLNGNAPPAGN